MELILQCFDDCKFPTQLTNIIKDCITSSSFHILCNGDKGQRFMPSRGICQGDLLFSYLFVFCMGKLSHIISGQVEAYCWRLMRACWDNPKFLIYSLLMIYCCLVRHQWSKPNVSCTVSTSSTALPDRRSITRKQIFSFLNIQRGT